MKQYKTYIDEAGNTGDNLLDLQQPLFVLSAVSVPAERIVEAENMWNARFLSVKEKEETEIKATKWYKASKKQQAMAQLLQELQMIGTRFHLVVVEKRFMIAGGAVNTFFDYANVGSDDRSFVNNCGKRRAVADYYEQHCTDAEMTIVGEALRKPTREDYLRAIHVLQRRAPEQSCNDILDCAEQNVDGLLEEEVTPTGTFNESVFHSPNLTALAALGNMIARMCKDENAQTSFIYDDCSLCNSAYHELFKIYSAIESDFKIPSIPMHYTWKDRVLSLCTAKSQDVPLLQAADILATCTDKVMQKVGKGAKDFTTFESSILMQLRQALEENRLWIVTSQKLKQCFINSMSSAFLDDSRN